MRLLKEECLKLMHIRYLGLMILLMSVFCFVSVYLSINSLYGVNLDVARVDAPFRGLITQEKYDYVNDTYQKLNQKYSYQSIASGTYKQIIDYGDQYLTGSDFSDMPIYKAVLQEYNRIVDYANQMQDSLLDQQDKISYLEAEGHEALAAKLQKTVDLLSVRKLYDYEYVDGMQRLIESPIAMILSMVVVVYATVSMVVLEHLRNMDLMNKSTRIGRSRQWFVKQQALILFAVVVLLYFDGLTTLAYMSFDAIRGWSLPIYQLKSFAYFPYEWTVFVAWTVHYLLRLLLLVLVVIVSMQGLMYVRTFATGLVVAGIFSALLWFSPFGDLAQGVRSMDLSIIYTALLLVCGVLLIETIPTIRLRRQHAKRLA